MSQDVRYRLGNIVFVWDPIKADEVLRTRGIPFEEAASALNDENIWMGPDSQQKDGAHYVGVSFISRMLLVVNVLVESDVIRIVTAWHATKEQKREYREQFIKPSRRDLARETRDPSLRDSQPATTPRLRGFLSKDQKLFIEFAKRHGIPRTETQNPFPPKRSRVPGKFGRMQERGWAFQRATRLSTPGKRLQALRKLHSWTQAELSNLLGVERAFISSLERDKAIISRRYAEPLAKLLGVSPAALLWRNQD